MENKFCSKCGQQNNDTAIFCVKCGNSFAANQQPTTAGNATPSTPPFMQPPVAPPPPPISTQVATPPPVPPAVPSASGQYSPPPPQYSAVMEMNYPKASIGSRFLACLVDTCIGAFPFIPGTILLAVDGMEIIAGLLLCIAAAWAFFYGFCKDGFAGGQSYGKKMNGLMVVNLSTNQPCDKVKSLLRAIPFYIPYVGGIIELIVALASDQGRRLGDKLAGTQVIDVKQYRA